MQVIECKNLKVDKNDPRGPIWCPRCVHYTIVGLGNHCECCGLKIAAKPRNLIDVSIFEKIVLSNHSVIEAYSKNKCPKNTEFGWIIQFGFTKLFVPITYILEFTELKDYADLKPFVERVKKECFVLPRYVKSVK